MHRRNMCKEGLVLFKTWDLYSSEHIHCGLQGCEIRRLVVGGYSSKFWRKTVGGYSSKLWRNIVPLSSGHTEDNTNAVYLWFSSSGMWHSVTAHIAVDLATDHGALAVTVKECKKMKTILSNIRNKQPMTEYGIPKGCIFSNSAVRFWCMVDRAS